jgi:hypothetical protein
MQEETEADEEVDVAEERRPTLLSASGDAPGGTAPVGISPHSLSMRQSTWSVDICSHVDEVASKSDDELEGVKREAPATIGAPRAGLAVADRADAMPTQQAAQVVCVPRGVGSAPGHSGCSPQPWLQS